MEMRTTRPGATASPTRSVLLLALVALISVTGCDGQIGGPEGHGNGSPGASTGSGSGAGSGSSTGGTTTSGTTSGTTTSGTTGGMALDCSMQHAPVLHARLLTPSQYNNTASDLVKVGGDPSKDFGGAVAAQLDDLSVERRANAAADIARQAMLTIAQWSPCMSPPVAAATCEQQIIDKIGPQLYRHPLSAAERTELVALFDAGVKEKDFATGVEWFLGGALQSPDFLYQLPKVQAGEQAGQVRALAPYELASRLSYFVWD